MIKDSLNKKPLVNSPTLLDDATATILGLKQYFHGTNYNGGNAPTLTLTGGIGVLSSVDHSCFIPYQLQDGTWRLRFNIAVTITSPSPRTSLILALNGIAFSSLYNAAIYGYVYPFANLNGGSVYTTNNIALYFSSSSPTAGVFEGDVPLLSKPNWAY